MWSPASVKFCFPAIRRSRYIDPPVALRNVNIEKSSLCERNLPASSGSNLLKIISLELPVCQTNWTQTYVLAAKNNQCTGRNIKHTKSEQKASVRKRREKAWKTRTGKTTILRMLVQFSAQTAFMIATLGSLKRPMNGKERLIYGKLRESSKLTYQTLVLERVVSAPQQQPKGPKIFKAKLQKEVRRQHHNPY